MSKKFFQAWIVSLGVAAGSALAAEDKSDGVKIIEQEGKLRVEINGALFTEYHFKGAPHVYFYPLLGPVGAPMTRNYPMVRDSENEEHDHPHHRSLWYSHGDVNGIDFWSEGAQAGKIVHDRFLAIRSGRTSGLIKSQNKWVAPDGRVVCTDERTFRVYARPDNERLFDFEVTLAGPNPEGIVEPGSSTPFRFLTTGERVFGSSRQFHLQAQQIILGDTKEGSFALRIAESMRLTHGANKPGKGHIVQSTGARDDKTWGKAAEWCDYYGPVNGKTVGIAIFDHPRNPRHPTTWHVRDYGLFAANPFGLHDFEKKPARTGDLKVPAGQSVTFRYRVYLHEGDEVQAKVAERYQEYVKGDK